MTVRRPLLTLLLLLVSPAAVRADSFTVRGFVVDQHNEPVPAATITLDGADQGAVSDSLGNFVLTGVPRGVYGLHVREGCEAVTFLDTFAVPRPLQAPYPVIVHRLDFGERTAPESLGEADQAALIAKAFDAFVHEDRRALADAFLGDGVIRLVALNASITEIARGDRMVALRGVPETTGEPAQVADPIPLQVWLGAKDGHAFVHLLRATPALPDELDLFVGDRGLFVYTREGETWTERDQLICIDAEAERPRMETAAE